MNVKLEKIRSVVIKIYITHETHTIIFTIQENVPVVLAQMSFKASLSKYISFVHYFGIIIKEKCSPFNEGTIQQPIMSINKVITPMTELSDPPSYCTFISQEV